MAWKAETLYAFEVNCSPGAIEDCSGWQEKKIGQEIVASCWVGDAEYYVMDR